MGSDKSLLYMIYFDIILILPLLHRFFNRPLCCRSPLAAFVPTRPPLQSFKNEWSMRSIDTILILNAFSRFFKTPHVAL